VILIPLALQMDHTLRAKWVAKDRSLFKRLPVTVNGFGKVHSFVIYEYRHSKNSSISNLYTKAEPGMTLRTYAIGLAARLFTYVKYFECLKVAYD